MSHFTSVRGCLLNFTCVCCLLVRDLTSVLLYSTGRSWIVQLAGGYMATLVDPDSDDFTIAIVKIDHNYAARAPTTCVRGCGGDRDADV